MIRALDIGGTKTIAAVLNETGKVIQKQVFPTGQLDFYQFAERCGVALAQLEQEMGCSLADAPVGISLPGMVDPAQGILLHAPFAGWRDVPAQKIFREVLGTQQVVLDNDARNCARGEIQFGNAGKNFIWMTVSTGIGSALVSGGNLLCGSTFCAGELGHIKVEYQQPLPCTCGQMGCLEAQASGTAIGKRFQAALAQDKNLATRLAAENLPPDALGCAMLAKQGDETCLGIYHQAGSYIGKALSYAVTLLNPHHIYVGGGISRDLELILPAITQHFDHTLIPQSGDVQILQTALGYEASLLGAAALVLQTLQQ